MPNIGSVLKGEITRLSRKVVKEHVGPVHSATSVHRRQLAALKRQVAALERQVARMARDGVKGRTAGDAAGEESDPAPALRFQTRGLKSLRDRLDLSAADFGKLVGVSAQSVYNWEAGKAKPRRSQIAALAPLRSLGKREARARLEQMATDAT